MHRMIQQARSALRRKLVAQEFQFAEFTFAESTVQTSHKLREHCRIIRNPKAAAAIAETSEMIFQSRLVQLESDVTDLRTELAKLAKGDGGASGREHGMRFSARRYESLSGMITLLGTAMMILAPAHALDRL